jgi:AraC family transcriptional regulator, regulatory protein of adaptative response / DNA-3-methyladenine glycosylase II
LRTPFAGRSLLNFLAFHLIAGVETAGVGFYARTLDLPHGPGVVRLDLADSSTSGDTAFVKATFTLEDLRDTAAAVERVRRLVDADCDPLAVDDHFAGDPVIGPLVGSTPGLRVPGQVDGNETAIRAVIGQQVSVAGACTVTGRLVAAHGRPISTAIPGLTHLFPDVATLAQLDPESLPMPRSRGRALVALSAALAHGDVALDRGPDRDDVRRTLVELSGIGPWTADYVALRALAHPDVFLPTDIGVRNALIRLGHDPAEVVAGSDSWRPWRSYALMHLWNTLMPAPSSAKLVETKEN